MSSRFPSRSSPSSSIPERKGFRKLNEGRVKRVSSRPRYSPPQQRAKHKIVPIIPKEPVLTMEDKSLFPDLTDTVIPKVSAMSWTGIKDSLEKNSDFTQCSCGVYKIFFESNPPCVFIKNRVTYMMVPKLTADQQKMNEED